MKHSNSTGAVNLRRFHVLNRLEDQLKSGVKPTSWKRDGGPLDEADGKRIKKEIDILKKRIMTKEVARATRTKKYRGAGKLS